MKSDLEHIASFITENPNEILTEDEIREQHDIHAVENVVSVIGWDDTTGEATTYFEDPDGDELMLSQNASDNTIVGLLNWLFGTGPKPWRREIEPSPDEDPLDNTEDKFENPGDTGWQATSISRSPSTVTVEWRDDRNHLSISVIIWI